MPVPADPVRRAIDLSIDPSRMYRCDDLSFRMGWRPSGWRAARRAGLRVYRCGKRLFVLGRDVIQFVQTRDGEST